MKGKKLNHSITSSFEGRIFCQRYLSISPRAQMSIFVLHMFLCTCIPFFDHVYRFKNLPSFNKMQRWIVLVYMGQQTLIICSNTILVVLNILKTAQSILFKLDILFRDLFIIDKDKGVEIKSKIHSDSCLIMTFHFWRILTINQNLYWSDLNHFV